MERSSEKKTYVFDTSALISLGTIKAIDIIIKVGKVVVTDAVINELEAFAKYDDKYGKASKEVLKHKNKFIIKKAKIKEPVAFIQKTDNELYNLAKSLSSILITDDIKLSRHVDKKIEVQFSTLFLTLLVSSKHLSKEKALELLEELRDMRNWRENIIYLNTKNQLEQLE